MTVAVQSMVRGGEGQQTGVGTADERGPRGRRLAVDSGGYPAASRRASAKTSSSIDCVSLPVKVFCWLGW